MTPEQREELKAAAQKANAGPWELREAEGMCAIAHPAGWVMDSPEYDQERADYAYVAAANPAAILSLIAQVEALTVPQWISVKARLPDEGQRVLVARYAGRVINPGHPGHPGVHWLEVTVVEKGMFLCDIISTGNATHWQPLPTIPAIPGTKEDAKLVSEIQQLRVENKELAAKQAALAESIIHHQFTTDEKGGAT